MNPNEVNRRPLIDPLLLLLKSRRVMIALMAVSIILLAALVPPLALIRGEITLIVLTLAVALIIGYSVEDAARATRETPQPYRNAHPDTTHHVPMGRFPAKPKRTPPVRPPF